MEAKKKWAALNSPQGVRPSECAALFAVVAPCLGKNLDEVQDWKDSIPGKWLAKRWNALFREGLVSRPWQNVVSRVWTTVKRFWTEKKIIVCDFFHYRGRADHYVEGEHFPKEKKRKVSAYTYPTEEKRQGTTVLNTLDATGTRVVETLVDFLGVGLPPPRGSP